MIIKPIFEYLLQELKIELEIKLLKTKYFLELCIYLNNNFEKINNLYRNTYDKTLSKSKNLYF